MTSRIHYAKPSITELEVRYATDSAANGWGEKCYKYINHFEEAFKTRLGVQYAIATSSWTRALHGYDRFGNRSRRRSYEVIMVDTNWIEGVNNSV
jgi:perosamine synthetase